MVAGPDWRVAGGGALRGRLRVPGDKSISHRAAICAALAPGASAIDGFLAAEDTLATVAALRRLGVDARFAPALADGQASARLVVRGGALRAADGPLDLGNSGTGMRLLAGVLAAEPFASVLDGDESLRSRPMRRIVAPLREMGAEITEIAGCAPLRIRGGDLRALRHAMPVASAQVKSCLMLAALRAAGRSEIVEPQPSRDHSERMLERFGVRLEREPGRVSIVGGQALRAADLSVPGDLSSAMFFVVAASIAPGSELVLPGVGINPTRTGALGILERMGADIRIDARRMLGAEPIADLSVRAAELAGAEIAPEEVVGAIDEFPALFVAAARARGLTRVRGAGELRVKESDRIAAMAAALAAMGARVREVGDGVEIVGGPLRGAEVDSAGDHRVAMAMCVAGLAASGRTVVRRCGSVGTSFPGFFELAASAGAKLEIVGGG